MLSGQLRDKITIQVRSSQDNAAGEPVLTWSDFAINIYANTTDMTGREFVAGQTILNAVTTTMVIRFRRGVTAAMRVVSKGVTYNIQAVLEPENKRREMHLICQRNVSNG